MSTYMVTCDGIEVWCDTAQEVRDLLAHMDRQLIARQREKAIQTALARPALLHGEYLKQLKEEYGRRLRAGELGK